LHQGVLKHLVSWLTDAFGAAEIDARCRRLPPNHNIRLFMKGITILSRVTGQEHDQISRILLGLILEAPLPGGYSPVRLVRSVRSLLDFLYIAQYPVHTTTSLQLLENSLARFHENKSIFIDLGVRDGFNIPKLHFMTHYVDFIKAFGTIDQFNTSHTERLHIDFTKDAYRASNRKDEYSQMTQWLERKEKVHRHEQFIRWRLSQDNHTTPRRVTWVSPGLELNRQSHIAATPDSRSTSIDYLINEHGATYFRPALSRFIALMNDPTLTARQLEHRIWAVRLPLQYHVWYRLKYRLRDQFKNEVSTVDSIHSRPSYENSQKKLIPGRFDTALVEAPNAGKKDLKGMQRYRVVRIHVIFAIPPSLRPYLFSPDVEENVPKHLVYVSWYSAFAKNSEANHLLYKVEAMRDEQGGHICSIIPLSKIVRSVHLFPKFGPSAPAEWTSSRVLDQCSTFYVNCFTDRHLYRVLVT
ncbi:hypothetical protein BDN72DRAFT_774499, partial [Pluteus cervinus]